MSGKRKIVEGKNNVAYRPEQRSPERPLRERGVMYNKESQKEAEVKSPKGGQR